MYNREAVYWLSRRVLVRHDIHMQVLASKHDNAIMKADTSAEQDPLDTIPVLQKCQFFRMLHPPAPGSLYYRQII